MSKKIVLFLLLIPILFNLVYSYQKLEKPSLVKAQSIAIDESGVVNYEDEQIVTIEAKELDKRAVILKDYLASKNSPMQYHAQDFIDAADYYQVDWKLVPAIAGVESNFGKYTPGGFNGWGWGVYGDQAILFSNWRAGIFTVTKGLKEDYIARGLTDPYSMNKRYASSPTWGMKVSYFLADIDGFAKKYDQAAATPSMPEKISEAGNSASLASVK
jgi:hypothetical protein